jgi:hypothetical protein
VDVAENIRPATMPRSCLELSGVSDMAVGKRGYIHLKDVHVDLNNGGWISPIARVTAQPPEGGTVWLIVERTESGFVIDLRHRGDHRWKPGLQPEPACGRNWIKVARFVGL